MATGALTLGARSQVCRFYAKYGECREPDCVFKHSTDDVKECNMFKLGFCIHGPNCRYKHIRRPGPPPDPATVEACKPKEMRNMRSVMQQGGAGRGGYDGGGGRGGRGGRGGGGPQQIAHRPFNM